VRAEVGERKRKKCGERMWLWWWAGARFATYGAAMVTNTSRVEARRRVREAQARANEVRAQRERADVEDAATFMVATGRVSEVDAWESERRSASKSELRRPGVARIIARRRVPRWRGCSTAARR
jgi:hypothetical protein